MDGPHHEVGPHDLFFSTTDRRGVITDANEVFVRLSGYRRERLMGAPHSIIRHDDMPAGAFKLMWDALERGEAFCAYVDNLSQFSSTYTVFATLTQVGDEYLSVRVRPACEELLEVVHSVYTAVRAEERAARRDDGIGAREAAVIGERELMRHLRGLGYDTYNDFVQAVLPLEVSRRERPVIEATGPMAGIIASALRILDDLAAWTQRQQALLELSTQLKTTQAMLRQTMTEAQTAGASFAAATGSDPATASIMLKATVWSQMMAELARIIEGLTQSLSTVSSSCARTRFLIALATLHTQAVAQFGEEVAHHQAIGDPDASIRTLCRALTDGVQQVRSESAANAALVASTAADLTVAHDLLAVPRDLIVQWQEQMTTTSHTTALTALPQVAAQVRAADELLGQLRALARACQEVAGELDTSAVEANLHDMGEQVAAR